MNSQTQQIVEKIEQFMESQSHRIVRMLELLHALRSALIRRQEEPLRQLQDELHQESAGQASLDEQQVRLREQIAAFLKIGADQVCLSRILEKLPQPYRRELEDKRQRLQTLAGRLQQEHLATELLLRECTRLNRKLLEVMLGQKPSAGTYDARGRMNASMTERFMNLKI